MRTIESTTFPHVQRAPYRIPEFSPEALKAWNRPLTVRSVCEYMEELATIFNVEADETYIGGLEMNKHESKKLKSGRGNVGKTPVTGIKDWQTNQIRTQVAERTNKATLQDFVVKNTEDEAIVYTDEHAAYTGLPRYHEALRWTRKTGQLVKSLS